MSKRDASGEYDASEAVLLSPDGDLTVTQAGTYILSGDYEGMTVVVVGEEDRIRLALENATVTDETVSAARITLPPPGGVYASSVSARTLLP